jgi:ferredoxin
MVAPTLLRLRDQDGRAEAVERDLDDLETALAKRAALSCPEQAIAVTED